ncbi:hypothetical protein, partial [Escherichia coli]|uniref:hypothetical protein n=1 Tax=Escherichia coli TaxID=562 RepID=UPI0020778766
ASGGVLFASRSRTLATYSSRSRCDCNFSLPFTVSNVVSPWLTGISLFVATLLGIHAGFSFSAGAIDYALMYNLPAASQNVWM